MPAGRILLIGPKALHRLVSRHVKRREVEVVWFPRVMVATLLEPRPHAVILDGTAVDFRPSVVIGEIRRVHRSVPIILIVEKKLRLQNTAVTQVSREGLLDNLTSHFERKGFQISR